MADPLKLRGEDEEDLGVISAILQDALVAVGEMAWLPEERRFALVANRFRRELPDSGARRNLERRMAGLRFDEVKAVQRRGFNPREADRLLVLLAIRAEAAGEVERILCHLDDLGEPWPTRWQPRHPVEDDAG